MPERREEQAGGGTRKEGEDAQRHQGGYEGAGPEYGRGYGRDFGGGGRNQGFDGSWGQGYDASVAPSDYREGFGGEAYGGGMSSADYDRSVGGRGENFGGDDRSWIDRCADDEAQGRRRHRGRGPKHWARDDQLLYEEVCERLLHDRLIDARGIEVEVDAGVVTLRGEVRAPADPALAQQLVREIPGVRNVEMELVLRPKPAEPQPQANEDDRIDKSPLGYPILPT